MYNIVQKPIENGHKVPGTTVIIYLILFLTITGVFFFMGRESIIVFVLLDRMSYRDILQPKLGNVFFVPHLDNVLVTAYSFSW